MKNNLIKKMALLNAMKGAKSDGYYNHNTGSDNRVDNATHSKETVISKNGYRPMPLTEQQAISWVKAMKHNDGTTGELITMEQAKEMLSKKGYTGINLPDFYAMVNAMKSDYSDVAKKFNIMTDDFYCELAKAFIQDKDAKPYKTALYREYIAM